MIRRAGSLPRRAATLLVGLALLVPSVPATAAPRAAPDTSPAANPSVPGGSSGRSFPRQRSDPNEPHLPVTVRLDRLDPKEVRPDSTVIVVATLTNTGITALGPLRVRLQRGGLISTRSDLDSADQDPPLTQNWSAPWADVAPGLPGGGSVQVTYQVPAADLGLRGLGVYPLGFTVQANDPVLGYAEVGRLDTFLPFFPVQVPSPTRVAWLWPLLDRPHQLTGRAAGGSGTLPLFLDDKLGAAVQRGGRLDWLLAVAARVTGSVKLTLVIDPEMIEALRQMSTGYEVLAPNGNISVGRNGPAAAAWLQRLRTIAPKHLLVAVPYADPDVVALERGGLTSLAESKQADLAAVRHVLGVTPSTQVAWPPGGLLTDRALDYVVGQGAQAVVLDPAALPGGASQDTPTASAASPLPALGGLSVALVGDRKVEEIVSTAVRPDGFTGGIRVAEQRYLAELAMITAEQPSVPRTLVITPPRRWTPSPTLAHALVADLDGKLSWLTSVSAIDAASDTAYVDRGPLVYPAGADRTELARGQVHSISGTQQLVADLRTAVSNPDANLLLSGYDEALRRCGSSAWRDYPKGGNAFSTMLRQRIVTLRSQVHISTPAKGVYTLTSTKSPLSLTVVNDMPVPVKITLGFDGQIVGLNVENIGVQEIPARRKITLRVPAEVQRTGTFTIRAEVRTPAGGGLGPPVDLTIRSTAYGALTLGITGLAFAVLVCAVCVRLVRRLRGDSSASPTQPAETPAARSPL